MCVGIHLFASVDIHVFVCYHTLYSILYNMIYVLKGRELKERERRGLYHRHNLKFGSWEALGGLKRRVTFLHGFSYNTRVPGTEPSCYRKNHVKMLSTF